MIYCSFIFEHHAAVDCYSSIIVWLIMQLDLYHVLEIHDKISIIPRKVAHKNLNLLQLQSPLYLTVSRFLSFIIWLICFTQYHKFVSPRITKDIYLMTSTNEEEPTIYCVKRDLRFASWFFIKSFKVGDGIMRFILFILSIFDRNKFRLLWYDFIFGSSIRQRFNFLIIGILA